ncbi:MAG: hypothetical protein JWL95_318 [Gemmatimonadetes bacterium]|nr:hypothetical protein [Gemmatimonadota bacterium]
MTRAALLLAGFALLSGCGSDPIANPINNNIQPSATAAASRASTSSVEKDLAALRHVTAPFQDFDVAVAAGWSAKITDCMSSAEGGMGFHYGNTHLINGTVSVTEPELLLYEPQKNGHLRLVAVEYIIPYTELSRDAAPPVLFGQEFTQNDVFQLWGLHAWVWKENPSGVFANWNPTVSCEQTSHVSTMSH